MRKRRHPFRGIIGGLLLGVGLAIMAIVYGINTLGMLTPWVALLIGLAIGILLVFVPRPWGRRRPAERVAA